VDSALARNVKASGGSAGRARELETAPAAATVAALRDAEVVVALDLPLDTAALAPRARWVQAYGAGTGQLVRVLPPDGRVRLSSAAGVGSAAIAEFVLARLLQLSRRLRDIDRAQRELQWRSLAGQTLAGQTMLIIGYGAIGSAVGHLARAFGMNLIVVRARPGRSGGTGAAGPGQLVELLPQADVVVLSAAETASSRGMIGARELAVMKPASVLVNVARGALVDEAALLSALRDDSIGAAILDVTIEEPLPPGHPFWGLPNVYLSPHLSTAVGGYASRLAALFTENLIRYVQGRTLLNAVDLTRGY
jgi:phosphoglycerate dehydrogenase-like enzyme